MYRRILIPVSQAADVEPLIRFGASLLDADGEIRVLHVIPIRSLPEVTRRWRESVALVVPAHEAGAALDVRVDPEVRSAPDVPGEILESASTHSVDAILMTLRGSRKRANLLVGHTASSVLHHAPCDVMVVNRLALVAGKLARILVPSLADTPPAKAMKIAEELAIRHQGAPIVRLTIARRRTPGTEEAGSTRTPRGITVTHHRAFLPETILGRRHRLPELLLQQAARYRYGLLLVGEEVAHGEGPLLTRRFLEELFRRAPCPVVAVRGWSGHGE
ncbi:MAG TPA: universal stress protein [Thermoplasmata archaeon]|nr:universal stress protein [Thermoplasmata archaeon]